MTANEQTRKQLIQQALDSLGPEAETYRVHWRGQRDRLPVIRIGLDATVLNPRSHRIKAQLESSVDAKAAIDEDPDGEAAQVAVAALLRATPGFEPLKQNLQDDKQQQPGIITRSGRLINGNTRAVALRDLGEEYIDVAVLPPATLGEMYDLELDLQVAQDYRQDYSFTNELLFVDDLITEENRNETDVAVRLRWATPTKPTSVKQGVDRVRRYVRHLALIREIQQMSGGNVPLTDFDDAEQALQELDTAYEGLRNKDPLNAQRLKQARTLGLLVDLGYLRQRAVDASWVETYLSEALEENEVLKDLVEPLAASLSSNDHRGEESDLDEFEDFEDNEDGEGTTAHRVVEVLVRRLSESAQSDVVSLPTADGEREFDRAAICAELSDAMRVAVEDAKNAAKAGTALDLPLQRVQEAARQLVRARQAYEKVRARPDFDRERMHRELESAARALEAIQQTVD